MSHPARGEIAQRLLLYLDPAADDPLYRQIADRVWMEVVTGTLETGERLPTVRQLAIDLNVPPNTIEWAYRELQELGVVSVVPGQGVFVRLHDADRSAVERRRQLDRLGQEVATQAEGLGFTLDDLIEVLAERRRERRANLIEGGAG